MRTEPASARASRLRRIPLALRIAAYAMLTLANVDIAAGHPANRGAAATNDSIAEALLVVAVTATINASFPPLDSVGKRWAVGRYRDADLSRTLNLRIADEDRVLEKVAESLGLEVLESADDVVICARIPGRGAGPYCGLIGGLDMLFVPTIVEFAGDTAVVTVGLQGSRSERLIIGGRNESVGVTMKFVDGNWKPIRMITVVS